MRTGHPFGDRELPNHSGSTPDTAYPMLVSRSEHTYPSVHSPSSSTTGTTNSSDPDREGGVVVIACRTAMFTPNIEPHSSNASAFSMQFHRCQPSQKSYDAYAPTETWHCAKESKGGRHEPTNGTSPSWKKKNAKRRRRRGPPLKACTASRPCRWGRCKTRPYPRNALA